jgi:hypothetical protein
MNIESAERIPYKRIDVLAVSTYKADRVVYQHVEQNFTKFYDDSFACLLIIKDNKMFFFEDGYDDRTVEMNKFVGAEAVGLLIENELWPNKISGKLNHVIVTDRRMKVLEGFDSEKIESRFGAEYKEARDQLIKQHVQIFYSMLLQPGESEIALTRKPIPRQFFDDDPIRFFSSAAVKTKNGRVYYAADTNGDGVTDTFTVKEPDGFHWGFKSGPNLICILNNSQEDIKAMIGNLVVDATNGPEEFWNRAKKNFIQTDKIEEFVDDLYGVSEGREKYER